MYSGDVWNCDTRTRETTSSLTAIVRCLTSFFTPGRSTTIRGGLARAKSLAENQPSPTRRIATLPLRVSAVTLSRAWATSPRAVGAGATATVAAGTGAAAAGAGAG